MTKRKYTKDLVIEAMKGSGTFQDCACRLAKLIGDKAPVSRQRMKQLADFYRIDYYIERKLVTVSEVVLDKRYRLDNDSNS